MDIEKIYIGGWFQRTTLQLSEIYDFIRSGTSQLKLDPKKLKDLHENLNIESVTLNVDNLENLTIKTKDKISLKIFEDGLIVLGSDSANITESTLSDDINNLTSYYETKLSPAISFIFSLGAPVPKELANIKTVYPYFVVLKNSPKTKINELLARFSQEQYFEINNHHFDVYRGDKIYIINSKDEKSSSISRFVEEQIFLREFKGQLHHYLNLHRVIWERIDGIKDRGKIKGKEISRLRDKLESYSKTINLVEARINQMSTYLRTRERIATDDAALKSFLGVIEYRYETLGDTLSYIQQIWTVTKNYTASALKLFSDLQEEATQKSVESLTVVTSMGVGATLIGLFTATEAPEFTVFGVMYFFILAAVGYAASKILGYFARRKSYEISDVEYAKNIK
jgi:hypothetical protein